MKQALRRYLVWIPFFYGWVGGACVHTTHPAPKKQPNVAAPTAKQAVPAPKSTVQPQAPTTVYFTSNLLAGIIGKSEAHPADDPFDNIFPVSVPQLNTGAKYYLQYQVFGVADHAGIARSINDAQATGGRFVRLAAAWSLQREEIPQSMLREGNNIIRFSLPDAARYYYRIKDVCIVAESGAATAAIVITSNYALAGGQCYVKGMIRQPGGTRVANASLFCNHKRLPVVNDEFEAVLDSADIPASHQLHFTATLATGATYTQTIATGALLAFHHSFAPLPRGITQVAVFHPQTGAQVQLCQSGVQAGIHIPAQALARDKPISITALRDIDLPALNEDMVNVTAGAEGYRFLPHGSRFGAQATLSLPFDSTRIPDGYTAADIKTFFFDEGQHQWVALPRDSIQHKQSLVASATTHFTDMINGIIKVPESPQTQGYTPTSIKDFKAADPSAGIDFIHPPAAGQTGSASLGFAIQLPAGRQGMQPALTVQYNNESGNSWMGLGWNLSTPAIRIDTRWGVPRYQAAWETETYQLGGEQLSPISNRGSFVARQPERIYHPRVEGAFHKIIRHGNSPTNYWWEVINKNGTRSFYGGKPALGLDNAAVLKDANGNVGYWALTQTVDLHGNFVNYYYETVYDAGVAQGTVPGSQLYISSIAYTGFATTDGPYVVRFTRDRQLGEAKRPDIEINGRNGFKMVTADLLRKVTVLFNGEVVRSYDFTYQQGEFYKTLLQNISVLDDKGAVFFSHHFDYYDEIKNNSNLRLLQAQENWSVASDGIQGNMSNPIPGFTAEASALSTSQSSNVGGGLAVTVGLTLDVWSKRGTIGGSFSYDHSSNNGLVSMVDLNGDGLPDKVFQQGGQLWYRAGSKSGVFGSRRSVNGIGSFCSGKSNTFAGGIQIVPYHGFLGYNHSSTTAATTAYFADFNRDGLVDIASGGQVYFNHLDANANPVFETGSTQTPSPIVTGSAIDKQFLAPDAAKQAQQEKDYPLQDMVRVWKAPFSGVVAIHAPVQLMVPTGIPAAKADGVKVSIQSGADVLWNTTIAANDVAAKTPVGVSAVPVQKGQCIYFRVQSVYNGEDDLVRWDPEITYTSAISPLTDANGKSTIRYQASEDFLLDGRQGTGMGKEGAIAIDGNFLKQKTSDTVTLQISLETDGVVTPVAQQVYPPEATFNGIPVWPSIAVQPNQVLHFAVSASSYIHQPSATWQPHYYYTSFTDTTPVINSNGRPTIEGSAVPEHTNVNEGLKLAPVVEKAVADTFSVTPYLAGTGSGPVVFTIKGSDSLWAKQTLQVVNGVIQNVPTFGPFAVPANTPLYVEYATANRSVATSLSAVQIIRTKDTTYTDGGGHTVKDTLIQQLEAGLFTSPANNYFGPLYRGWGSFAIKGDPAADPINESRLNQNELQQFPSDPSLYNASDTSTFSTLPNPAGTYFIATIANATRQNWMGYDTSVYVTASFMGAARLWMHDVAEDSLMAGQSLWAPNKITSTSVNSYALGITGGLGSATYSTSTAKTVRNLDVMDMNGDGYPDVLHEEDVQYTLPNGALEPAGRAHHLGAATSKGSSKGFNLGGKFSLGSGGNSTSENARKEPEVVNNTIGLSGNVNSNQQQAVTEWLDINGDGLPDKLYDDGRVALNMGYGFTAAEQWHSFDIDKNSNASIGAGLGVNIASGSFEAGFGLSRTTADNSSTFLDVNGDGLADKISYAGGTLTVWLNTGNGFASPVQWGQPAAINSNVSTGESVNAAYTYVFDLLPFLPIKICINPSFNTGRGVSRGRDQIMDMDGDGIPDMVHSENDGHLTVMRSAIGRTNMLKTVKRPMGSWFTLTYERIGNSYQMPQSKWVLTGTTLYDGVSGDGADTLRNLFSYGGGYYNRHEREFYGFDTVVTTQVNTTQNNAAYRRKVQVHNNKQYYAKGLVVQEWTEDAAGRRFTQTDQSYDVRKVQDSCYFPALIQTRKLYYEGMSVAGASTTVHMNYDAYGNTIQISDEGDGSRQDLVIADITYHDNNALYLKAIPAKIEVNTAEGLRRKRATTIDAQGNITSIRQYLTDDSMAVYQMRYDGYGNLAQSIHPLNYKGDTMWYAYTYDNTVHSYTTRVTDAYGYSSSSSYEYRFGTVTATTSINNEPMRYGVDNRGRMTAVTGPYEIAVGKPYTIAFEYYPGAATPYAVTRHYDPEYQADINTLTFMDGLGRAIQVKKQVSLFTGKGLPDKERMVVSGKNIYDAYGRTITTYYPVTEALGAGNTVLSTATGKPQSSVAYDVEDRPLKNELADGATTTHSYSITGGLFHHLTTDALNNRSEIVTDVRNRQRQTSQLSGPQGTISTLYAYNALDELITVTDNAGNKIVNSYDRLGRKTSVRHPDQGLTEFRFDLAGNRIAKITAHLRKEISAEAAVQYLYDRERITGIDYPKNYQNRVTYKYGAPGSGDRAGRLILQEDASGGEEYYYGKLGEVTKTICTVLMNSVFYTTYVCEQEYDTWNRIKRMVYADSEMVTYAYNRSGGLKSMKGAKLGNQYAYVDQLGYDEYEQRVYLRYGNGTETRYTYDSVRRRLTNLSVNNDSGGMVLQNQYGYDAVSNITTLANNVKARPGALGGFASQAYTYDNLYRLTAAQGRFQGATDSASYTLGMQYDNLYNITRKTESKSRQKGYDLAYTYSGAAPHQPSQIGDVRYGYDQNGNQTTQGGREYFWDEENRLMAVLDSGVLSEYSYDAKGERVIKSSGGLQGTWINGAPAGLVNHYDNYTVYVSPYLVCTKGKFTKHFYIESQRISSKIGIGNFTNIAFPMPAITAGGIDYVLRAKQLQHDRLVFDTSLGLSPGPPTNKLFYALPQNNHIVPPVLTDSTASSIPPGWPGNTTPPTTGPPIYVQPIPSNDSVHAGYGFAGTGHFAEDQQYFYHSDHLGSTAYLTNILGTVVQHVEYIPFGETFFEEHKGSYESPYLFNAKEQDEETGLYYYGARYYNPVASIWVSVDPMAEKYPGVSPYNYTLSNPVKLIDPDGRFFVLAIPIVITAEQLVAGFGLATITTAYINVLNNNRRQNFDVFFNDITAGDADKSKPADSKPSGGEQSQPAKKPVTNPYGPKGKPDHQDKVKELTDKAKAENPDMEVLTEKKIKLEGSNRRPDVQVVDPATGKTVKVYEAERNPGGKRNKAREAEYDRLGIEHETHKVGKQ